MDLGTKAQWHKDFNGGLIPIVEAPNGKMIPESSICMNLALRLGADNGADLIPHDPMEAAKMRYAMEQFSKNEHDMNCNRLIMTRGQDEDKLLAFQYKSLPFFEEMCSKADDKFLLGTDDLTLLDIHCAPFWEKVFLCE